MRLTGTLVKTFEREQQAYGTMVALYNLLWLKAAADLKDLGVTRLRTATARDKGRRVRGRSAA